MRTKGVLVKTFDNILCAIIGACFIALACVLFFGGMAPFTEILMRHPETAWIFGVVLLFVGWELLSPIISSIRRRGKD